MPPLKASPTFARFSRRCFATSPTPRYLITGWIAEFNTARPHSALGYLTPPMKDVRVANARREIPFPTLAQCFRAFECMPEGTPRSRRDKAFFAFMMLTAARVSAALSLPLKHVDLVESCIQQDAREVATKFSKTFRTDFFPVDAIYRDYFYAWVKELREIHLFGHADPLFPRITEHFVSAQAVEATPQLKRQFQKTDTNIRKVIKDTFVS